jgi:hypothetical protein
MKTAKEWAHEYWQKKTQAEKAFIPFLRQVQLDAYKAGMIEAALLCDENFYEHNECRKTILKACNNKTTIAE